MSTLAFCNDERESSRSKPPSFGQTALALWTIPQSSSNLLWGTLSCPLGAHVAEHILAEDGGDIPGDRSVYSDRIFKPSIGGLFAYDWKVWIMCKGFAD